MNQYVVIGLISLFSSSCSSILESSSEREYTRISEDNSNLKHGRPLENFKTEKKLKQARDEYMFSQIPQRTHKNPYYKTEAQETKLSDEDRQINESIKQSIEDWKSRN